MLSNSQLTKLGERLRSNEIQIDDLKALDDFRQTFSEIDESAYRIIQDALRPFNDLAITKRKRKTQQSIVDKLRRQENLRLPQMQDIAGCRIVLHGGIQQSEKMNAILIKAFEMHQWGIQSKNRHANGYHAIHIITKLDKKFHEIQLRTYAQDVWANLIESASDKQNTLKYGGNEQERPLLTKLKLLAEQFREVDEIAHTLVFEDYQRQIQEVIQNVLSH